MDQNLIKNGEGLKSFKEKINRKKWIKREEGRN